MRQEGNHEDRPNRRLVRDSWIAGSCAGLVSTLVLHPLDVLRTKLQASAASTGTTAAAAASAIGTTPAQVLRHTWQHGGVPALYTGLALPVLAQAIYKGTVFTVNNVTQRWLLKMRTWENHRAGVFQDGSLTMTDRFWCGFAGGAVNAAAFVTPVELIRNQLIAQHSRMASAAAAAAAAVAATPIPAASPTVGASLLTGSPHPRRNSWDFIRLCLQQKNGVLSLWRGIQWAIARDGFGCGCFFYAMEATQQYLLSTRTEAYIRQPGDRTPLPIIIASGGAAGLAFWVVGLPFDTIKTWVQSSDLTGAPVRVKDTLQGIYNQEGPLVLVQRLCRGWQVAYGRGIPSAAITIVVYSLVYHYLQQW